LKWAKTILYSFIAITLLVATTGMTLHKHYCMGRLKAVAINQHIDNCSGEDKEPMPCCKDVAQELKVEEVTQTVFDFDSHPHLFQIACIQFFISTKFIPSEEKKHPSKHYPPPIPVADFQANYQVFII